MQRSNKLNPHMTPDLGIEPGPRWWEASALTTAPSLSHQNAADTAAATSTSQDSMSAANLFKLLWPISRKARNFSAHLG